MSRYDQLLHIIDLFKPQSIIETGVWNGHNAIRMIKRAELYHRQLSYTGFDLFEDATAASDAEEFNVKSHNEVDNILALLRCVAPGQHIELVKGNTKTTMNPLKGMRADFAYIDGGHSIETIEHDFHTLIDCGVIVLDDYYTPDEAGNCPDISKYGCNQLVDTLVSKFILPAKDPVKGGGYTQYVLRLGTR